MKKFTICLIMFLVMFVTSYAKEVKVMIRYDGDFHENAVIYPMVEWSLSIYTGGTTLKKMYQDGWRVVPVNNLPVKTCFITMEKD